MFCTRWSSVAAIFISVAIPLQAAEPSPLEVEVDLTTVGKRMVATRVGMPAKPGELSFHYPKWIPGTHSPIGPVTDQAGIQVTAGTTVLPWTRDEVDPFTYQVAVPQGSNSVAVAFDLLLQPNGPSVMLGSALTVATPRLIVLNWNEVLVYPKGEAPLKQQVRASVKLPTGWKFGTALAVEKTDGDRVTFAPVSLEKLIDSPVLTGEYFKEVPIGPTGGLKHRVVMACDSPAGLEVPEATVSSWNRLIVEAEKLFGARHYGSYTFLLALSDHVPHFGLEHHESSDNRLPELALITAPIRLLSATLLPHEYVHSWNGKFRRPADMLTADYQQPPRTKMLWVYEGLTNYLGWVLAARCGLWTEQEARDSLAIAADRMTRSKGRAWRPLEDTASASHLLYAAPNAWSAYRRSVDFYDEGTLIWLEADVIIRQKSGGAKSLDDFCRRFHGGDERVPSVKGYTLDDVVADLNAVVPYEWKTHLTRRVGVVNDFPPLDGITEGGWSFAYAAKPTAMFEASEGFRRGKGVNLGASIGLLLSAEGKVSDVVPEGPAAKAGLAPGMAVTAVNGRRFSADDMRAAVAATKTGGKLELLTENGDFFKTITIDYTGGAKYPTLERVEGKPDRVTAIMKPLAGK